MRIGLIGVGRIGMFHASTLRGLPGVDSLIITDADQERARQVAAEFGAQTARSAADLLGSGLDALVIAAVTGAYPKLIKCGVQAGVPGDVHVDGGHVHAADVQEAGRAGREPGYFGARGQIARRVAPLPVPGLGQVRREQRIDEVLAQHEHAAPLVMT